MDVYQAIEKTDVVSFDMFDTLVYRLVTEPKHLFYFLGKRLISQGAWGGRPIAFMKARAEAEARARRSKGKAEVTLEDIYSSFDGLENDNMLLAIREECKLEEDLIRPTKGGRKLFEYALEQGKNIVLTSDMYLPKDTLVSMLERCGYCIQSCDVFVSSEYGVTKRRGGLFKLLSRRYASQRILHIGDNRCSDYLMPRLYGINSSLFREEPHRFSMCANHESLSEEERIEALCLDSLIYSEFSADDIYEEFALSCFLPLMLGFCSWLNDVSGKNQLCFLAREGHFLKECYEAFGTDKGLKHKYLFVSRKAIIPGSLACARSLEDIEDAYTMPRDVTALQFVRALGLTSEEMSLLNEGLLDKDLRVNTHRFRALLDSDIDIFLKSFERQEANVLSYLSQNELDSCSGIVDVGWKGSMQDALCGLLANAVNISGFYLGVRSSAKNTDAKSGYLYGPEDSFVEFECRSMTGLIELLFAAPHGTTVEYSLDNGVASPVLAENELSGESYEVIRRVQQKVLEAVAGLSENDLLSLFELSPGASFSSFCRFGINPSMKEAALFSDFDYYDQTVFSLVDVKDIWTYMKHPPSLIKDFGNCAWKGAFLRQLLGGIPDCGRLLKVVYKVWKHK